MIGGGVLFCLTIAGLAFLPTQPAVPIRATVTFIGPEPDAGPYAPGVRIVARTEDGRTAELRVPSNQLSCRVGDRIPATSRGASVRLDQSSCADLGRYN